MVLTLFSEVECAGKSAAIKDREVNLSKVGVSFQVKSAKVEGNPWILFTEERYQGFLCYLEEGSYDDLLSLGIPATYRVASAKLKGDSVGNPQITLYNSSNFKDELSLTPTNGQSNGSNGVNGHDENGHGDIWWSNGDQKLSWVDAGVGGVWAITPDMSVMFREGTGHGLGTTGKAWCGGLGKMRNISVGSQSIWGLNRADEVFVRIGLSKEDPKGKEWTKIEGSMTNISVGPTGVCWAVDKAETVWRRLGAKESNVLGTKWQSVTGKLKQISVGQSGIWGVSPKNEVMYRDGTFDLPGEAEGNGWTKVDGIMTWVASGTNIIWGLSENGELWYRAGISQSMPMGNNWFKMNTRKDTNIAWKMVVGEADFLWGLDSSDKLLARRNVKADNIEDGNSVNLFDENGNFKCFNIQEKPNSYVVHNGGWVIYEKANFKGKMMFHHDGDCFSNDPLNSKGPKLKCWQDSIGSVRPLTGKDWRRISVNVELDWKNLKTEHDTAVEESVVGKNNTFNYVPPVWNRFNHIQAKVSHSFELSEAVPGISGCNFCLEGVPKAGVLFANCGNKLETGVDFRQELSNMMTFHTEKSASRQRTKMEVVRLPPTLAPMYEVKVSTVVHSGIISMPFTATFNSGNSTWTVFGTYRGVDSTNIKLEFEEKCLLESNRKVSKV